MQNYQLLFNLHDSVHFCYIWFTYMHSVHERLMMLYNYISQKEHLVHISFIMRVILLCALQVVY